MNRDATDSTSRIAPQELTDGTIVLRPYRPEDGVALYAAARESIREASPWLPWCHEKYTLAEAEEWIALQPEAWREGTEFNFAITGAADGGFLGGVGINQINRMHGFANLGYWVRSSATGNGIATRAARLCARFGLERLGLHRVEILAGAGNLASQRVAVRAGGRFEGTLRSRLTLHGELHDAALYSLLPADFSDSGPLFG